MDRNKKIGIITIVVLIALYIVGQQVYFKIYDVPMHLSGGGFTSYNDAYNDMNLGKNNPIKSEIGMIQTGKYIFALFKCQDDSIALVTYITDKQTPMRYYCEQIELATKDDFTQEREWMRNLIGTGAEFVFKISPKYYENIKYVDKTAEYKKFETNINGKEQAFYVYYVLLE